MGPVTLSPKTTGVKCRSEGGAQSLCRPSASHLAPTQLQWGTSAKLGCSGVDLVHVGLDVLHLSSLQT